MPKYYVSSGDLKHIITRKNTREAAIDTYRKLPDMKKVGKLGLLTMVSERGFDSEDQDDSWYITTDLLEETEQADDFSVLDWM